MNSKVDGKYAVSPPGVEVVKPKEVKRKGSLKERLKKFPSSLASAEKRKNQSLSPVAIVNTPLLSSQAEKSLESSQDIGEKRDDKRSYALTKPPIFDKPSFIPSVTYLDTPPAPPNCKRRGSIGVGEQKVNTLFNTRISPRKGSLDCLVTNDSTISSPNSSDNSSTLEHVRSHPQQSEDSIMERSSRDNWFNSLRNARDNPDDKLRRTAHYQPFQKSKDDSMKLAFELNLSPQSSAKENQINNPSYVSLPRPMTVSSKKPKVPPRTKFLTPSERKIPIGTTDASTPSKNSKKSPNPIITTSNQDDIHNKSLGSKV